ANDDRVDHLTLHEMSGHIVGDQRVRNSVTAQLPDRQARALEYRARFVDIHVLKLSSLPERPNHAQRSAITSSCEIACVAVRQDADAAGKERCAFVADPMAGRDVLV